MNHRFWIALSVFCVAGFFNSAQSRAQFTFVGPIPYRSAADSPFNLSGLGTTFFLEDFEGTDFATGIRPFPFGKGEYITREGNSVDADDGLIDDSGALGMSFGPNDWVEATFSLSAQIIFEFDEAELGFWPTAVGMVLTDGSGAEGVFIVVDAEGMVATRSGEDIPVLSPTTANDDRFVGVINPKGIVSFTYTQVITSTLPPIFPSRPVPHVDHLQYGLVIPEPCTLLFAIFTACCCTGRSFSSV